MRLQKFLAHAGIASRRKAETLIKQGKVEVNNEIVKQPGLKIDPNIDAVKVEGKYVNGPEKTVYIILNKPRGVITTKNDPQGRKTVIDLVNVKERIYPVGRLDYDARGLVLLTNHGELAFRLTHPSYQVPKTYLVKTDHPLTKSEQKQLISGIKLEEGMARAKDVLPYLPNENAQTQNGSSKNLIKLVLCEGKKRQIKRMLNVLGKKVIDLQRVSIGPVALTDLSAGKYRHLSKKEIHALKSKVGLAEK